MNDADGVKTSFCTCYFDVLDIYGAKLRHTSTVIMSLTRSFGLWCFEVISKQTKE